MFIYVKQYKNPNIIYMCNIMKYCLFCKIFYIC